MSWKRLGKEFLKELKKNPLYFNEEVYKEILLIADKKGSFRGLKTVIDRLPEKVRFGVIAVYQTKNCLAFFVHKNSRKKPDAIAMKYLGKKRYFHVNKKRWRVGKIVPLFVAYRVYIRSNLWQAKREQCYRENEMKCVKCGTVFNLTSIHHNGYPTFLGKEKISTLEIVCDDCHAKSHSKRR